MALPPAITAQLNAQLSVMNQTHRMVSIMVEDFREQLYFIDPPRNISHREMHQAMRDGALSLQVLDDLIWDVFELYVTFDRFARETNRRNGPHRSSSN